MSIPFDLEETRREKGLNLEFSSVRAAELDTKNPHQGLNLADPIAGDLECDSLTLFCLA